MSKQRVVLSVCDRCHIEVETPFIPRAGRRDLYHLPKGWLHVQGNTATHLLFEMDLCGDCKGIVLDAAGRHQGKVTK